MVEFFNGGEERLELLVDGVDSGSDNSIGSPVETP